MEKLLEGVSVLHVDDEEDAREAVGALLNGSGATVLGVESAPLAMKALESFAADVLVLDIALPGEDGHSLLKRIRASELPARAVPAVALSAYLRDADVKTGFQVYLSKPVTPHDLIHTLAQLARGKSATS